MATNWSPTPSGRRWSTSLPNTRNNGWPILTAFNIVVSTWNLAKECFTTNDKPLSLHAPQRLPQSTWATTTQNSWTSLQSKTRNAEACESVRTQHGDEGPLQLSGPKLCLWNWTGGWRIWLSTWWLEWWRGNATSGPGLAVMMMKRGGARRLLISSFILLGFLWFRTRFVFALVWCAGAWEGNEEDCQGLGLHTWRVAEGVPWPKSGWWS